MLIQAGDRRLYYDLTGPEAAPVVCLAHCLSGDSGVWAEQLPVLLAAGWRVLRIDMRGHGGSSWGGSNWGGSDAAAGALTMAQLAADVVQVLDFLGLAQVHFAGLSIGGMIGQQLALSHPHRLHSALLSGTSPKAVPGGQAMWDARFEAIGAAGSLDPIADASMERWVTSAFRPRRPSRWQQIHSTIANTSPQGYRAGAEAIIAFDVLAQLGSIKLPTLVVCGDGDTGTPPAGNRQIAALIPGASYEEIANARHLPMVEHPELFGRIMCEWLAARR